MLFLKSYCLYTYILYKQPVKRFLFLVTVRESNPITIDIPRVSPELRIQDNDDNDSTVTDSQGM